MVSNLSASSPLSCPLGFQHAFFPLWKKDWVWWFSYSSRSSYKWLLPLLDLYGQLKVCEWVQVFDFNFREQVFLVYSCCKCYLFCLFLLLIQLLNTSYEIITLVTDILCYVYMALCYTYIQLFTTYQVFFYLFNPSIIMMGYHRINRSLKSLIASEYIPKSSLKAWRLFI